MIAVRLARGLLAAAGLALSARPVSAQTTPKEMEIAVRGIRPRRDANELKLSVDQARAQAGAEDDPTKALQNAPGMARPGLGHDQVLLWGAAPEDTRVYVDGVEIPQLFHGSGLRGIINGNLLRSVALTPGAFGADYGRAIGGMIRLETRDLARDRPHATLEASSLDASALVSAPLSNKLRLALAARYGLLDRTLRVVGAPDVGELFAVPRYRDYQAKLQLALRERESIDLVWLGSGDELGRTVPNRDPARRLSTSDARSFERIYMRYRRTFDDGSSVDVVPWAGRDESHVAAHFGADTAELEQRALRWGVRAEQRARVLSRATLRLGLDAAGSHANVSRQGSLTIPAREGDVSVFGQPPGGDTNTDTWSATVLNAAPYLTLDSELGPLTLTPSVRLDMYLLEASRSTPRVGQTPAIEQSSLIAEIEPRLSVRLRLSPRAVLLGAAGIYTQPPEAADLSAVFGTPTLGPERAEHASVGEAVELTSSLLLSVTGFYRALSRLNVRDSAPTPKLASALVGTGDGESYGAQFLLQQKLIHGFSGSFAYTLSRSERRPTPTSRARLFDYDEPQVLTVVADQAWGDWGLGLRFRFASGAPRTPVVGALYAETNDAYQPIFGAQNTLRLPSFYQLDVRVDRRFRLGRRARLLAYLELLNVTNHHNGEEYRYDQTYDHRGVVSGLPFVGVVGVRLEL